MVIGETLGASWPWNLNFISRQLRHSGKAKSSCNVGAMLSKCKSDSIKSEEMPSWCMSRNRKRGDNQMVFCIHGVRRVINGLSLHSKFGSGEWHLSSLTLTELLVMFLQSIRAILNRFLHSSTAISVYLMQV